MIIKSESIDQLFKKYKKRNMPGCAVIVVKDDEVLFRATYGYAEIKNHIPVTKSTNFRLASVAKHIMAVGVMVLVQDKKISLDDTLSIFFDDLPKYMQSITLFHLLTHTSGLPQYENLMSPSRSARNQIRDEEVLELLKQKREGLFPPGQKHDYNNGGWCLLRFVIEKSSQRKIEDFLKEKIFDKLDMDNTTINYQGVTVIPSRAFGYRLHENKVSLADQNATSATIGDGGLYSSIDDLRKWGKIFYTDIILSEESRKLLLTLHVLTDEGKEVYYGLGLFLEEIQGKQIASHGGSSVGFSNGVLYVPEDKVTIIFLSNRSEGDGDEAVHILAKGMNLL